MIFRVEFCLCFIIYLLIVNLLKISVNILHLHFSIVNFFCIQVNIFKEVISISQSYLPDPRLRLYKTPFFVYSKGSVRTGRHYQITTTEEMNMNYCESSVFQDFTAFVKSQLGLTADESTSLMENLNSFFESFNGDLSDSQIVLIQNFLLTLHKKYKYTLTQYQYVLLLVQVLNTSQNTPEICLEAAALLKKAISPEHPEKLSNTVIMRLALKMILPLLYDLNKHKPLEHKLLFMQPRQGLNETFRYLYHKLERESDYRLELYEFHRDTLSFAEYCVNAAFYARDLATAKTVFVHESNNLMGHINFRPETKVIQLWHGCGVFKHIGLSTLGKKGFKSKAKFMEFPEYNKYSLVTIASPELSWVFEEFMGIPEESGIIQPLGVARTDEFFDDGYVDECYQKLHEIIPASKDKKVILYAPTYRGVDPNRVSPNALDIELFQKELGDKYILIMKHHQTVKELPEIPESCRDTFAYDMTRGKGMNINELMTIADICITDYSSVAFEFSVFERPLLFFVYDLEEYIDDRGLYYNFDEITPGPLCRTTAEMADYIKQTETGFDSTEVTDFKNRFMCSCDGNACERTIDLLTKNYICYSGNGAESETYSAKYTDESSARIRKTKSGNLQFWQQVKHPIPHSYPLTPNAFQKEGYHFTGWHACQYESSTIYWYCEDKCWRKEDPTSFASLKKHLFKDAEEIKDFIPKNGNALFYDAQWKADGFLPACAERISELELKRKSLLALKKVYWKLKKYIKK